MHAGLILAYLGHEADPARITAWCLSSVLGFIGLLTALGTFPAARPGRWIRVTGAVMVLAAAVGVALSLDHAPQAIGVACVALAIGLVVVVLLYLRQLPERSEAT